MKCCVSFTMVGFVERREVSSGGRDARFATAEQAL